MSTTHKPPPPSPLNKFHNALMHCFSYVQTTDGKVWESALDDTSTLGNVL